MSLGLIVEGASDKTSIPVLARKLGYSRKIRARVLSRGDMLIPRKVARIVSDMTRRDSDIQVVVVCIDAEREEPDRMLSGVLPLERRLNGIARVQVRYAIVDHALEGWLACDEDALREVLGPRAKIAIRGNPERHANPADTMTQVFRANGRRFDKRRDNPRIAERVSPASLAERSPTFRRFADLIGHPAPNP